ncbi:TM1266 family iron-only hydrogenase system putative regulator [Geosporobacter ferrireducens]|uniref:CopG family transcriptional regulator n=1 Tax=Geosporobacter ferrireducens TaxID=1424294 RepID=A0A1D8GLJ7_9FIRM|nr:TM1266 family iron-only hydrogenase system putative regulator [Geosporobacter ferrireducens]AOT71742.1 CopG family transcriptional regulator [Geosporobacter ferrireducens]MTI55523.1 CopG family transcriptional regulator [Geosporobacter ferrireducens]
MNKRIGVVAIIVENKDNVELVNKLLSSYGNIIVGRMGVPYREKQMSIISIIVDGTTDEIGALTGKLGKLQGVAVKSALTQK